MHFGDKYGHNVQRVAFIIGRLAECDRQSSARVVPLDCFDCSADPLIPKYDIHVHVNTN